MSTFFYEVGYGMWSSSHIFGSKASTMQPAVLHSRAAGSSLEPSSTGIENSTLGVDRITTRLPDELKMYVLNLLEPKDLANLRLVNHFWHDIVGHSFSPFIISKTSHLHEVINIFPKLQILDLSILKILSKEDIKAISKLPDLQSVTFHGKLLRDPSFFAICLSHSDAHAAVIEGGPIEQLPLIHRKSTREIAKIKLLKVVGNNVKQKERLEARLSSFADIYATDETPEAIASLAEEILESEGILSSKLVPIAQHRHVSMIGLKLAKLAGPENMALCKALRGNPCLGKEVRFILFNLASPKEKQHEEFFVQMEVAKRGNHQQRIELATITISWSILEELAELAGPKDVALREAIRDNKSTLESTLEILFKTASLEEKRILVAKDRASAWMRQSFEKIQNPQ